jgi:hypothetical protein
MAAPRKGSASLVPTADLVAAKELGEGLENAGLAQFLRERLEKGGGKRLSADEFLAEIGLG